MTKLIPLNNDALLSALRKICWLPPILLYLYYFYFIWKYAVDIPYVDEWEYFLPDALPSGLTAKWLFAFHNEHRIIFTKFLAWLFLKMDDLNFAHQIFFNYAIFGGVLAAVVYVKKTAVGARQFLFFPLFMIFLLSPIAYDNHTWAFLSSFHFTLLFTLLASAFAFSLGDGKKLILSLFFTLSAMYSLSTGAVFAIVYLICFTVYLAGNFVNGFIERKKAALACTTVLLVVVTGLLLYFKNYVKPAYHPSTAFLKYWEFYLNILSQGFGFYYVNFILGIPCLFISLFPLTILLIQQSSRWRSSTWMLITITLGIHGALSAVAFGRTELGIAFSKQSRYTEMSFLLIPFSAVAWWLALENLPKLRRYTLILLWIFCFIGYMDKWSIGPYIWQNQLKLKGLDCVSAYNKGIGYDNCNKISLHPIKDKLYYAKQLKVSFTRPMLENTQK